MVKVTDFGIAKLFGGEELTRAGTTLGTSRYMSPEQILVQPVGVFSDIYSLGITLYEMVTGRVPFSGNSDFEIQRGHLELPPPPPRQVNPHLSQTIETAILKSLEKKPERRFPSVLHFLEALSVAEGAELRESEEKPLTIRGRWPFHLPNWKNAFSPDEWIARCQNLSPREKLMIALTGILLLVILLIIVFSIS
jgi:serine/threonine protein kinase